MKVAIPTHYRSNTIGKQALHLVLDEMSVPYNDVYLFVSNQDEYDRYKSVVPDGINIIVANTNHARDKFNYIHTYFEQGTEVLLVEDDVKGLVSLIGKSPKHIVEGGFKAMHHNGTQVWGIYPSSNKLFMNGTITKGCVFLVANLYGFVSNHDERLLVQEYCKTDYERSVLYSLYAGGCTRLNYVAAKTNNYTNKGGMQTYVGRGSMEKESCDNLVRRFPNHIAYKKGTKSIYQEIKLLR